MKRKAELSGKQMITRMREGTYHNHWRDSNCRGTVMSPVSPTATMSRHVCYRLTVVIIIGGRVVSVVSIIPPMMRVM